MQVAALDEHPEEVGHHEVVEDGGDTATPDLYGAGGGQGLPGARAPVHGAGTGQVLPGGRALSTPQSHSGKPHALPNSLSLFGKKLRRQPAPVPSLASPPALSDLFHQERGSLSFLQAEARTEQHCCVFIVSFFKSHLQSAARFSFRDDIGNFV